MWPGGWDLPLSFLAIAATSQDHFEPAESENLDLPFLRNGGHH